jgi:hypothetical protein
MMIELTFNVFAAFEAIIIALLVAIIGFLFSMNSTLSKMSGGFDGFIKGLGAIAAKPPEAVIDEIKKVKLNNPYSPQRKAELLNLWQQGRLKIDEAKELQSILQEDARIANGEALVAILLGLSLLGALIYVLSKM